MVGSGGRVQGADQALPQQQAGLTAAAKTHSAAQAPTSSRMMSKRDSSGPPMLSCAASGTRGLYLHESIQVMA